MSYEDLCRGDGIHQIPPPPRTQSPWSVTSARNTRHQYSSLPSSFGHQHEMHSPQPLMNGDFQEFEKDTTYSSQTHIVDGSVSEAYQPHGLSRSNSSVTGNPWRPGFWAQFPWLGVLALLATVMATLACVIVLVKSNGVSIYNWSGALQPTVYLSVCTAIANITLTFALYEGVVISFWRKAGRGATLRELHQYWHAGSSVWGALMNIFQFSAKATAIACLMTVASIGRGPLMQRASLVKNVVVQETGSLRIYSAQQLPDGYAGRSTGRTNSPSMMNPNFTDIVQAYTNKDDIAGVWSGCDSTCYANIKGFGFGVSCNISELPYNMSPVSPNGTVDIRDPIQVFTADVWETQANVPGISAYYDWALLLNTTIMATPDASYNGSLQQHLCALRAGIVEYPIQISNNVITLQSGSWQNDTFLEDIGMMAVPYNSDSNMAGFILAAKALYYGTAFMQFGGGVGWILNFDGASPNRYFQRTSPSANYYDIDANVTWRDPMDDMINSMREIAFRTSLQIAMDNTSYPNASQSVSYTGNRPETIYTANYSYMAGAVVLSLLGVIAVVPTYRGFWELGRRVTLSPLEVAKAFHAPLLNDVHGNRPAGAMLFELGRTKVRYGDSGIIVGEQLATPYSGGQVVKRIGMGPASGVRPPEKGANYI